MKITKTETEYNMKSVRFLLLTITLMFIGENETKKKTSHCHSTPDYYSSNLFHLEENPALPCYNSPATCNHHILFHCTNHSTLEPGCLGFQIISGLMIVLGLSVYSHYHSWSLFYESARSGRFVTPSIFVVLLGLALLMVTSVGFFGSLKKSTCLVNLYAVLLGVILMVKLVVVIVVFTADPRQLLSYIEIPVQAYSTEPEVQDEIDRLQVSLNCCGSDSYLDYVGVSFDANHTTSVVSREIDGDLVTVVVPGTCCMRGEVICTRVRAVGCKNALVNAVGQNAVVLGVLGVSVMFVEVLGITFAILLAHCIRKLKSEKALMEWKIQEQIIMARQNEETLKDHPDSKCIYIDRTESSIA